MQATVETFGDDDLVYIENNVAIEPLIDSWYAWAHLVSPATAALNIKERHLRIMNSYIQNPMVHAAAIKTPKMLGGPFIDYDGKRVDEISALKDNTLKVCADLLELCEAITFLNDLLLKEAKGYSMYQLYKKVPDVLKGMVELVYDMNNNPTFRFFEALLYKTKHYNENLQSINLVKIFSDDSRAFVLSTPRLPDSNTFNLTIPFRSAAIDWLFKTTSEPKSYGEIKKVFEVSAQNEPLFRSFFTNQAPAKYKRYAGDGILTRYFGHACILVETKDVAILVDPVISYGYESDISRFTYTDLPDTIDYVLITHNHQDHILFETLLRIRHKIKNIIVPKSNGGGLLDPSLKLMFEAIGFKNIIQLEDLETVHFSDCSISGIPFLGEHSDLDIRSKLCYFVAFKSNFKMLFAADSCNIEPIVYKRIHELYGDIDVLFLGMECDGAPLSWLYGPLMPKQIEREKDQARRLAGSNFEEGKALVDIFNPHTLFVYAMGMEPWLKYISSIKYTEESRPIIESNKLLAYCKEKGIDAERLFGEKILEYFTSTI